MSRRGPRLTQTLEDKVEIVSELDTRTTRRGRERAEHNVGPLRQHTQT